MPSKRKAIDNLPDSFATDKEAGEFWATHSAVDYEQYLDPTSDKIKIGKRVFEIQVSEEVFNRLRNKARESHKSLPKVADGILRKQLAAT